MNHATLEALEVEIAEELKRLLCAENSVHDPITDGVVDNESYLASPVRLLWILKEPWENFDEKGGGGWSVTRNLIPELIEKRKLGAVPAYRKMAYIAYSVLNGYCKYVDIPGANDARVANSMRSIAYVNVSKVPGKSKSDARQITAAYARFQNVLIRQISTITPDVVITGNILSLFYEDFGLMRDEVKYANTVDYFHKNGRLYINAYHPSYWRCKEENYVNDITTVIQQHFPKS